MLAIVVERTAAYPEFEVYLDIYRRGGEVSEKWTLFFKTSGGGETAHSLKV